MNESEEVKKQLKEVQSSLEEIDNWLQDTFEAVDEIIKLEKSVKEKAKNRKDAEG